MRLLYIIPEYPPAYGGGIGTFYEHLLPELVRQGHEVDVLLGSAFVHGGEPYEHGGVRVRFLETDRFYRALHSFGHYSMVPELQRHLAAAWAMHEQVDGGAGYDAVEVVDWGLLFVPWVVEARVPCIVQMHGSTGQIDLRDPSHAGALQGHLARLLEASVLRGAAALHTHSAANQKEWEEVTRREVAYIAPPLIPNDMPPSKRVIDSNGLVVGRIQKWKGPTVLCEALRRLGADAPSVKWVGRDTAYGESGGSMDEYLTTSYPDIWRKIVEPVGQVAPSVVARMQVEAGFVIVPSLWDVYNLTAVEAMRAGAILICSTGAGAVDLVEDGINGFVFPSGDAGALVDAMRKVLALSAGEREAISSAARVTVIDRLSPEKIAKQKVVSYEETIAKEGAGPVEAWTSAAASPSHSEAEALSFLDHQPLRGILAYSFRRVADKFRSSLP